jgi:hypothetical protein
MADELYDSASEIAFVVDEVDRCYNTSQRTSHSFNLAQLCPFFVAQTGTPVRSTKDKARLSTNAPVIC